YKIARAKVNRKVVLQTLVLEKWHGRSEMPTSLSLKRSPSADDLGEAILEDFNDSDDVEFREVCIRSLSKVNRRLLLERLEEIVEGAMRDRTTELSLALELSKLLDDDTAAEEVIARLTDIVRPRRDSSTVTELNVSLWNLLNDVGLELVAGQLVFCSWPKIFEVLSNEPPDEQRTIRFLIRSLRRVFGPEARILFYRVRSDERYQHGDSWPAPSPSAYVPVKEGNILARHLVESRRSFYSSSLRDDPRPE